MKILFAGDEHPYSEYAINETVKLAANTWADVTLLGVHPVSSAKRLSSPDTLEVARVFRHYRDLFLGSWSSGESPYGTAVGERQWKLLKTGRWEESAGVNGGRKAFKIRLRVGAPGSEILAEAVEEQSDIIVLGCAKGKNCVWESGKPVPQAIVNDADCSVLLVKQEQPVKLVRACFDQGHVSQESMEMINQMVTIHSAKLDLVGLSENKSINIDAFSRLFELGKYYSERDIDVSTHVMEVSEFEEVTRSDPDESLLAIWAGKKSLIKKFFPPNWIGSFVSNCRTSVLVMR